MKQEKNKSTPKAIHIAKSRKAFRTSQNLAISMSLPTHKEMKLVANLKQKYRKTNESQPLTLCISNGGQSVVNEINMNKINGSAKMKVSAEIPATTHTYNRYLQGGWKKSTELLIKFYFVPYFYYFWDKFINNDCI